MKEKYIRIGTQLYKVVLRPLISGDFIEEKVLSVFPKDFCQKYVPLNIYLTDTLMGLYSDWNAHAVNSKLIIGRVGKQFDELDKDELRDAWVSIFVERMLAVWPYPTDFAIISDDGYNPSSVLSSGTVITYQYVAATTDMVGKYAILKFNLKTPCFNDARAWYVYECAARRGLTVGKDVSIVGVDNHRVFAETLEPQLTTVELPHYEMGYWAACKLISMIERKPVDS